MKKAFLGIILVMTMSIFCMSCAKDKDVSAPVVTPTPSVERIDSTEINKSLLKGRKFTWNNYRAHVVSTGTAEYTSILRSGGTYDFLDEYTVRKTIYDTVSAPDPFSREFIGSYRIDRDTLFETYDGYTTASSIYVTETQLYCYYKEVNEYGWYENFIIAKKEN